MLNRLIALAISVLILGAGRVSAAQSFFKCTAQMDITDSSQYDCGGCTHLLIAGSANAVNCFLPCFFWADLTQTCGMGQSHTEEAWSPICGRTITKTWSCASSSNPYAGVRGYCAPCLDF